MDFDDLRVNAETTRDAFGVYGISVLAANKARFEDVVAMRNRMATVWDVVMVTTARAVLIHPLEFTLSPTWGAPHYTLGLVECPNDSVFAALRDLFEVRDNPFYVEPEVRDD